VSSSGHLALAHQLGLGAIDDSIMRPFSVMLHVATLVAVVIAFRREIVLALCGLNLLSVRNACLSVVPAVIVGLTLSSWVSMFEHSMLMLACSFLFTAMFLLVTDWFLRQRQDTASGLPMSSVLRDVNALQATWVGLGQAIALFPGVSRSGSSLCAAILSGVDANRAFAYSFLVGIPLIAGAAAHEFLLAEEFQPMLDAIGWGPLLWSMACSLGAGIGAIALLRIVLRRRRLSFFGIYCALLACACLVFVILE
jgi:undecaprenyl-diphosphatase